MKKSTLREISKFVSGLILGDFLFGLWFYFSSYLPVTLFGINFNDQTIIGWMVFDVLLFIFLFHYGWHISDRPRTKNEKKFHLAVGILLTLVALLHLSRILFGWDFVLGDWAVPYWINGLGTIVTGFLAYVSFSLAKKE